ncbi:MFS transporter [Sphingomonas sp.]|uniref:MFS transporter n=1 Tax=Sphingomonas sp. TaxID=28214 RepID=UPI002CDF362E|nr:MFS transporter [Sphingomonas sp.]HTG38151.1 MFS transporter [Sphingomonas sp.]
MNENTRPGLATLIGFGAGDFACNLYWQGITLYLLYFYTEALRLPPAVAGAVFMGGAIWDGLADVAVGVAAERSRRGYAWFVGWGAIPLALGFPLAFMVPPLSGAALVAFACFSQLALRTLYAVVNVPYAAWSTRISDRSADRTRIAGLRLAFGAAAATGVALGFPWAAARIGHAGAAAICAVLATPILIAIAARAPEHRVRAEQATPLPLATMLTGLRRNRAFVTLALALVAATIAGTLTGQSVLYYFARVTGDAAAGPRALAVMAVAGAVGVPVWTAIALRIGARATWLWSASAGLVLIAAFVLAGRTLAMPYLAAMQFVLTGLLLAGWSLLPDSVDVGEGATGIRVEAPAFGVAALVQKLAMAAAGLMLGVTYDLGGYASGGGQGAITGLMILGPAAALALSMVAIGANPIRRA